MRASGAVLLADSCQWQYIGITGCTGGKSMARTKNEVLTIRTTAEVKALLKLAAGRERRSAAAMVEVLVLEYAQAHDLAVPELDSPRLKGASN